MSKEEIPDFISMTCKDIMFYVSKDRVLHNIKDVVKEILLMRDAPLDVKVEGIIKLFTHSLEDCKDTVHKVIERGQYRMYRKYSILDIGMGIRVVYMTQFWISYEGKRTVTIYKPSRYRDDISVTKVTLDPLLILLLREAEGRPVMFFSIKRPLRKQLRHVKCDVDEIAKVVA